MTSINYSYFFRVELLHQYFGNGICNDFTIAPSALTQATLRGNKMLAKQYGNKLYTGVETDDSNNAIMVPANNLQLTFFLTLNNSLFYNYTNLPFTVQPGKVYYFTNRNENINNGKSFLSQPVPYDNAVAYNAGDIVTDGGNVTFECISNCTGVTPSIANNDNWMMIGANHFVSEADALQWIPSVSTYTFTTDQASAAIEVWAYNLTDKKFTNNVLSKTISFTQNTKSFTLNLSQLSPGKYKLIINGNEQWIYINDELGAKPVFAVIDIFNDSDLNTAYALLNGSTLKSPLYSIHFLNRATIWKYVLNSTSKGQITIAPPGFGFPTTDASIIVSSSPIPLSEKPLEVSLKLSTVNNVSITPLTIADVACASPKTLTSVINGTDKYACSEIFLNY